MILSEINTQITIDFLLTKRENQYFEIPAGKAQLEYSIPALSRDNANLKAALSQAATYCQERGAPFGAVSNGYQFS